MTVSEGSGARPSGHLRRRSDPPRQEARAAQETTELRWFSEGHPPAQVRDWFAWPGTVTETRCDHYLLDQAADVGVKVRGGRTLELKLRGGVGAWVDLGGGLGGGPEEWRRWSPADDVVEVPVHARWVSVGKTVAKRRFSCSGDELPLTGGPPGAGCDVEVTRLAVGRLEAWTFAFAASGPRSTRGDSLRASWCSLAASGAVPRALLEGLGWPMGYPQWLARLVMAGPAALPSRGGTGGAPGPRRPYVERVG